MSMEEIFQAMQQLVAEQYAKEPEEVTMETSFEEDLGADSVGGGVNFAALAAEFDVGEIQEDELPTLKTVGDAVRFIAGKVNG